MMNIIQEQSWRVFKPQGGGLMILGGLLIVVGVLALVAPLFTGRVIEIWVGANILIAGLCQIVAALKTRGWQHGLPGFLVGSIGLIGGSILLVHPMLGLAIFTLILAISIKSTRQTRCRLFLLTHNGVRPGLMLKAQSCHFKALHQ